MTPPSPNPFDHVAAHLARIGDDARGALAGAAAAVGGAVDAARRAAGGLGAPRPQGGRAPLASTTIAYPPRLPLPAVSDLAAAAAGSPAAAAPPAPTAGPPDLLARLSSVPVYAVVNKANEFVLVTGDADKKEDGGDKSAADGGSAPAAPPKELGLLFMSEAGARALADKVRKEGPRKMAKEVTVARTTLDRVFSLAAAAARPAGAERVAFRFVPDAAQVERAAAVAPEAGGGFTGVPVFQAAGLSVAGAAKRYTPLFLDAADLDEAVRGAAAVRDAAAAAAEAEAAGAALRAAEAALAAATDRRRAAAEAALEAARARAAAAASAPAPGAGGPAPPVEVGCLEAVLGEMAAERGGGPWSGAMLVPPGALAARTAAAGKNKKK